MDYRIIDFKEFTKRDEELSKVIRYAPYKPMFYRTNLLIHTKRLLFLVEDIDILLKKNFPKLDIEKLRTLALIHDDAEIITGDTILSIKLKMNPSQKEELRDKERKAIEILSKRWPKTINGFSYKELLYHAMNKDCIEARVLSYLDKIDAWCESLHELFAGNYKFHSIVNGYHPPIQGSMIINVTDSFPELKVLKMCINHDFFKPLPNIDKESILSHGKPFTSISININSKIPHYEHWKKITISSGGSDGLNWLINQLEF